jgi:hypothetical protein
MSGTLRGLLCRIELQEAPVPSPVNLFFADVILENTTEELIELRLENRLALLYRFVVRNENDQIVHEMSYTDGNAHFPPVPRQLRLASHQQSRTSFPLLRTIPTKLRTSGTYWVTAIFPHGEETIRSQPVKIVVP